MTEERKPDFFRETPVQYVGFANEIGESFRFFLGRRLVALTYVISVTFCIADSADKFLKQYERYEKDEDALQRTVYAAADALIFQLISSVVLSGLTMNRLCATTNFLLKKSEFVRMKARRVLVPSIGLCSIPLIITPLNTAADFIMDKTFRKILR